MSIYTFEGLQRLAKIIRDARGHEPKRAFARRLGVSHRTISRLEESDVQEPEITTLQKLAPALGYTKEQLVAILEDKKSTTLPQNKIVVASEIFPVIDQLSRAEIGKLIHYATDKLVAPVEE
jgi:transcriptional regulator with XRE-family HTH domain